MDYIEISGKSVDDAITNALLKLETTSDQIEYEVIEKGSSGFLGFIGKQDAVIKVRKKSNFLDDTYEFLDKLFTAMNMKVASKIDYNEESRIMNIDFSGEEMGILIGKRGQTLDSLQYLISLVVNKESDSYIKVKVDTEDYRERRKKTLENLAKNLSYKVKRTRRPVTLEPMNPYERRIIHSALQNDRYVETHSEGDEPYRKVVITLKKRENREYHKDYDKSYKVEND
ncbi:MAG: protein jag [Clostridia bacterium]|nr:protein jag [Lachnospiraceae bacterium]NCC00960.1 protein jag [Clostridia bacterium]